MAPLEGRVWNLNSIDHKEYLCNNIVGLLQDHAILDVVLICEEESIHAHKLILASCSSYFRLKLLNVHGHVIIRFDESGFPIHSDDLRSVIDFMYQGKISVPEERLKDILIIAKFLGVAELLELLQAVDCQISYNKEQNECESSSKFKSNHPDSICNYGSEMPSGFNDQNSLSEVQFDPSSDELEVSNQLANVSFEDDHMLCDQSKQLHDIHSLNLTKRASLHKLSTDSILTQSSDLNISKGGSESEFCINSAKESTVSTPKLPSKLHDNSNLSIDSPSNNVISRKSKSWYPKQSDLSNEMAADLTTGMNKRNYKEPQKESFKTKELQYFTLSNIDDRTDQSLRDSSYVNAGAVPSRFSDIACSISVNPTFETSQSLNSLNGSQNIDEELSELTSSIAKQIETDNDEDSSFEFRNQKLSNQLPIKSYSIQISSILCNSPIVEDDMNDEYNHEEMSPQQICEIPTESDSSVPATEICDKSDKIESGLSLFSVLSAPSDPSEYQEEYKESIARSNISIQTDIEMVDMDYTYPKLKKIRPELFEHIGEDYHLEPLTSIPLDSDNESSSSNTVLIVNKDASQSGETGEQVNHLSEEICDDRGDLQVTVFDEHDPELVSTIDTKDLLAQTTGYEDLSNAEKEFVCLQCKQSFDSNSQLEKHRRQLHADNKTYSCQTCNAELSSYDSLKLHNWKEHQIGKVFQCSQCPRVTPLKSSLSRHLETHKLTKDYNCGECEKKFKTRGSLQTHMKTHRAGDNLLKCPHCDFKTIPRFNLMKHLANLHGTDLQGNKLLATVQCPDCDFVCVAKHMLKSHRLRKHTVDKPFKCQQCHYSSVEKAALEKHIRIRHTHERPYMCEVCGFSSHTISGMARHRRSHTKVKPYKCETCGQQYADKKRLRDHMYKHSNVKPFTCDICSYSSRRKDNLQLHRKKTHGDLLNCQDEPKQILTTPICSSSDIDINVTSGVECIPRNTCTNTPTSTFVYMDQNSINGIAMGYYLPVSSVIESQELPLKTTYKPECNLTSCVSSAEMILIESANIATNCLPCSTAHIEPS